MGACCSAAAGSDASHDAHGLPPAPHGATGLGFGGSGGALAPFEDFSSLSTRKSAEKLETVTEEKDSQQGSPQHTGRHVPMQGSPRITGRTKNRDGLPSSSPMARASNEYQASHLSLNHTGHLGDEQRDMDKVLLSIPFFDALDLKHVKILRSFFTRRVYAPKEVVLAEGLPLGQQVFHVIVSGRVEMCAKDAYGKRTVLQQFGPGQFFGEMTWNSAQDQTQPVTVYALQRTTILYTSSYQFAAALQQFPQLSVAINIMNHDADDLAGLPSAPPEEAGGEVPPPTAHGGPRSLGIGAPIQIQLKSIPFFADIDELKLQQLAMLCEIRKKKAGTWICRQHSEADGFYYIISGRVEVSAQSFMDVDSLMANSGGDIAGKAATADRGGRVGGGGSGGVHSSPKHQRGSGNGGGGGGSMHLYNTSRLDDSPLGPSARSMRTTGFVPSSPLTPGFTPSPPSTPHQRSPQLHGSSSRKGFATSIVTGGGGAMARISGSFSASARESERERANSGADRDSDSSPHPAGGVGGTSAYLDTLSAGDSFGEIALLEQTTRTASVQATQDCILLYLSRERFIRFLKFAPSIRNSSLFADLIRKRTANSLKCLPIFAPLRIKTIGPYQQFDEKRLALLGAMFHYLSVPANTCIFNEGDLGLAFYIVIQGTCIVTAKSIDGDEDVFLNELHSNDFFGEASLLPPTAATDGAAPPQVRCNATVKTKTNCLLLKLNGENFQKFLQVAPEVEKLFRQRVSMRTSERLRMIPFFRNVRENKPWSKLDLLGALFTFEEYGPNEIVFHQGSVGRKFFIIVSGEIEISVAKEDAGEAAPRQVLEVLTHNNAHAQLAHHSASNGGWFGEVSLLRKTARTATARCVSATGAVLLSIDSVKFQKFLTIAPELAEDFTSLLIHRTSNLLRSFDLFRQVQENKPWSKMEMIASLFEYELVESGQTIYDIGGEANKFYVIASGSVRLESKWSGMQTLRSQASFGATEIMRNLQSEKAFKQAKAKYDKAMEERRAMDDGGASLPPLVRPPPPPVSVSRMHAAKAADLCGLMTMSISSFKSLLTIAPEIIPYFARVAEHEHRRVSEVGIGAMHADREDAKAASLEEQQKKDSISALVLPPTSASAQSHPILANFDADAGSQSETPSGADDSSSSACTPSHKQQRDHYRRRSMPSMTVPTHGHARGAPSGSLPHGEWSVDGATHPPSTTNSPIFSSAQVGAPLAADADPDEMVLEAAATRLHDLMMRVPSPDAHDFTDLGASQLISRDAQRYDDNAALAHATATQPARRSSRAMVASIAPSLAQLEPPRSAFFPASSVLAQTDAADARAHAVPAASATVTPIIVAATPSAQPVAPAASRLSPSDDEESSKAWLLSSGVAAAAPPAAAPTRVRRAPTLHRIGQTSATSTTVPASAPVTPIPAPPSAHPPSTSRAVAPAPPTPTATVQTTTATFSRSSSAPSAAMSKPTTRKRIVVSFGARGGAAAAAPVAAAPIGPPVN